MRRRQMVLPRRNPVQALKAGAAGGAFGRTTCPVPSPAQRPAHVLHPSQQRHPLRTTARSTSNARAAHHRPPDTRRTCCPPSPARHPQHLLRAACPTPDARAARHRPPDTRCAFRRPQHLLRTARPVPGAPSGTACPAVQWRNSTRMRACAGITPLLGKNPLLCAPRQRLFAIRALSAYKVGVSCQACVSERAF